ncbi:MAG: SgcJ/EcaC family oxidoreductase [Verrucomicrobiota bacterium]
MSRETPQETMRELVSAINAHDAETAISLYLPDAVFLPEPGKPARGLTEIRACLNELFQLKPHLTIERHACVEAGDVALYWTAWALRTASPNGSTHQMNGRGAVILRQSAGRTWAIAIENPWTESL